MASKLDSTSKSTSTKSSNIPKSSIFGVKSGFVIPKNKLSGSLVPLLRGGGKTESGESNKEETVNKIQRKTRWGIDLTQDASVRRGKSLAYQTRVEQITRLLKSSSSEVDDDELLDSSDKLNSSENHELLELEKRELIGELLRLNSKYKAPPDYKPLLKEAEIPIPVKEHPGYNPVGMILGSESGTQKRLEEETGARVHVYGIHKASKEKREITRLDMNEAQETFENIYVNITADSYEKVDAAVSLIELLLTPVNTPPAPVSSGINTPEVKSPDAPESASLQSTLTSLPPPVMPNPHPPATRAATSQSTQMIRPSPLITHQAPRPLTSVTKPLTTFNVYTPIQTRPPFHQIPSPAAFPVVQNQPRQISPAGFIPPLKPPPSTSGQFTFQPHLLPSPPPLRPLTQTLQPPRMPVYGSPNLVHALPRPAIYGNPSPVNMVVPPRQAVYGNASALIQAHGQHVQSHNLAVRPPAFPGPPRPIKRETDPDYEDLMASVGVK